MSEAYDISDRELLLAIIHALGALAETVTGKRLQINVTGQSGQRYNLYTSAANAMLLPNPAAEGARPDSVDRLDQARCVPLLGRSDMH
jgi:hypothetical protein